MAERMDEKSSVLPGVVLAEDGALTHGVTELMVAVFHGHVNQVRQLLLRDSAMLHLKNDYSVTALEYAVSSKQTRVIDVMLGHQLNMDTLDSNGLNILHRCVLSRQLDKVQFSTELGARVDYQNSNGDTALILAAQNGNLDIAKYLIHIGCDVTIKNKEGFSALEYGFIGNHQEIQTVISENMEVDGGIDEVVGHQFLGLSGRGTVTEVEHLISTFGEKIVNYKDCSRNGASPFIVACQEGSLENAKILKKYGANMNISATVGDTALITAAKHGQGHIVEWLVSEGAVLNTKNFVGRSALHCSVIYGNLDIVKKLVQGGILLNSISDNGSSAVCIAVENGFTDILKYLLERGAYVDIYNENNNTPLAIASLKGDVICVKHLAEHGANVNRPQMQGYTALMLAINRNHLNVVKCLVELGADITFETAEGHSAIGIAAGMGRSEIYLYLTTSLQGLGYVMAERDFQIGLSEVTETCGENQLKSVFNICRTGCGSFEELDGLLQQGVDINDKNEQGRTPLITAIVHDQKVFVNWLIEKGAHLDLADSTGMVPVMHAAERGLLHLVDLLVQFGADVTVEDNKNRDALEIAKASQHLHVVSYLQNVKNRRERGRREEFFGAVRSMNYNTCAQLISEGLDVDCVDLTGCNALSHCIANGSALAYKLATLLCNAGVDFDLCDPEGRTPLQQCVDEGCVEIAELLLRYGAKCEHHLPGILVDACMNMDIGMIKVLVQHIRQLPDARQCITLGLKYAVANDQTEMLALYEDVDFKVSQDKGFWRDQIFKMIEYISKIKAGCKNYESKQMEKLGNIQPRMTGEILHLVLEYGCFEVAAAVSMSDVVILDVICPEVGTKTADEHSTYGLGIIHKKIQTIEDSLKEMQNMVYTAMVTALTRSPCEDISGMLYCTKTAMLYICTSQETCRQVETFIEETLHHLPHHYLVQTKVIPQGHSPKVLVGCNGTDRASNNQTRLGNYSITTKNLGSTDAWSSDGTVGCFLKNHLGDVYAITSIHSLGLGQSPRVMEVGNDYVLSNGKNPGVRKVENNFVLSSGQNIEAKLTGKAGYIVDCDVIDQCVMSLNMAAVCIGTEMDQSCTDCLVRNGYVYYGDSGRMMDRKVYKIGYGSGKTEGVVVDDNVSFRVNPVTLHHGSFVVRSLVSDVPFAAPGDSGAAVIDVESGLLFGLVVAEQKSYFCPVKEVLYDNVTFCVPLYYPLKYLQEKTSLQLGRFRTL